MEMWAVATFTLIAGMVDDFRSRKVHNQLVLILFPLALLFSLYFRGLDGTLLGVGTLVGALVITLPFFVGRILGGGDVKLFTVFAFCVEPKSVFYTLLYSFVWGALFGITRAALQKELMSLVRSTYRAGRGQRLQRQEVHTIPYTFALLMGWFTQLTILHNGGYI